MARARAPVFAITLATLAAASATLGQSTAPSPMPDQVERGRYLVVLGDCEACHTRSGGERLAGGYAINTPFGTIYSANITPDRQTGIGGWNEADFYRAMHEGKDNRGRNLYPAFPYPYFTRLPRADVDAIFAYLRTVPPVAYSPPPNRLQFPFSIRWLVSIWNSLNFKPGEFRPDPRQSSAWNRGAYIVNGPGHCGACHTPKNFLSGDEWNKPLRGGLLDNWFAPDLNEDAHAGLTDWSHADIVEFLRTGRNRRAGASGSMSLVIADSTSAMSQGDLTAIAAYLKSLPSPAPTSAPNLEQAAMQRGAAVYRDQCASCHRADGSGVPTEFPPLGGDALAQQRNPTTVLRFVLSGTQTVATSARPTPFAMPSFAWKLSDQEIADVATYVRNSWGNVASRVSAGQVASLRKKVAAKTERPPPSKA